MDCMSVVVADSELLKTAREAAAEGGEILNRGFRRLKKDQVKLKGAGDFVTELDHRSEEAIIARIRRSFPGHAIQAEESGIAEGESDYRWTIDPLDGTNNYVHGVPVYSVSIAVSRNDEMVTGVVFDPAHGEMFWAVKGEGAFLNGSMIRVSQKEALGDAFLASGFPWRSKQYLELYLDSFRVLFSGSAGVRRMGSAAIDLSYTACGRFDGFWEMKLKPWDIAAGVLIVREAGGVVSDFIGEGQYMKTGNLLAANPHIFPEMLQIVKTHLAGVQ
jgi:myo-inositol-1(or 4)-monophosphatase